MIKLSEYLDVFIENLLKSRLFDFLLLNSIIFREDYQTWDKLRIVLATELSSSESVAAAIIYDPIKGYRLLYNYKNEPKDLNGELTFHIGFVELILANDSQSAEGSYYNVAGRTSSGTMKWTKQPSDRKISKIFF